MSKRRSSQEKAGMGLKIEQHTDTKIGPLEDLTTGSSSAKVLDFFLIFDEFDYSEADIRRGSSVSQRHLYRVLPKLVKYGILEHTRKSGKSKMYRLNKNEKAVKHLEQFVFLLAMKRIEKSETWPDEESKEIVPIIEPQKEIQENSITVE